MITCKGAESKEVVLSHEQEHQTIFLQLIPHGVHRREPDLIGESDAMVDNRLDIVAVVKKTKLNTGLLLRRIENIRNCLRKERLDLVNSVCEGVPQTVQDRNDAGCRLDQLRLHVCGLENVEGRDIV